MSTCIPWHHIASFSGPHPPSITCRKKFFFFVGGVLISYLGHQKSRPLAHKPCHGKNLPIVRVHNNRQATSGMCSTTRVTVIRRNTGCPDVGEGFIWMSLSEPHTSMTSLRIRVYICLLACLDRPLTKHFKWPRLNFNNQLQPTQAQFPAHWAWVGYKLVIVISV